MWPLKSHTDNGLQVPFICSLIQMYHSIGTLWATSLLGFFAVYLIPIPYVFYVFEPRVHGARGKYSANLAERFFVIQVAALVDQCALCVL